MKPPRGVTIIIPNYNYARFLSLAIDSALAQDHLLVQVIVADDCSTEQFARDLSWPTSQRVEPVLLPRNGGQIAAVQAALAVARYEVVMVLNNPMTCSCLMRFRVCWRRGGRAP